MKTQVWCAVATYVLIAIVKKQLHLDASLYTLLQILSVTLFEKLPLHQVLADLASSPQNSLSSNQLTLFEF